MINYIQKTLNSLTVRFNLNINIKLILDNLVLTNDYDEFKVIMYVSEIISKYASISEDYDKLAAALFVNYLHTINNKNFVEKTEILYEYGLLNENYYKFVQRNSKKILEKINYEKDYEMTYLGVKTLYTSYLLGKYNKEKTLIRVESPQDLWMRVGLGLHYVNDDIDIALECYSHLSDKLYTHASPTLYNAGCKRQQLASCFLLNMNDSVDGMYKTIGDSAKINKWSGGIGFSISKIRASDSIIKGTNGKSSGLLALAKVLDSSVLHINQGGKRNGAVALYLELWHKDIYIYLDLKRQDGSSESRARNLFYGLWVNDLFMERVEKNELWSLMCPNSSKGLSKVYGKKFNELYIKYESEKNYIKQVKARELFDKIIQTQQFTGGPYFLFKDKCNEKSNQKNIGTIQSSNLCTEIIQYSDSKNYSVCNLASICLPKFVNYDSFKKPYFDYKKLKKISEFITNNLNNVIDINYYPIEETRNSNMNARPIGLGVQGLADVFIMFDTYFGSDLSIELNKKIFETIYFGSLTQSVKNAKKDGAYKYFKDSPFSKGELQFHMWGLEVKDLTTKDMWDWDNLIKDIKQYGTRNSLLTTCMPTASTSHIMGNNECIEPFISNIYTKSTINGDCIIVNKYLVSKLKEENIWNETIKNKIINDKGSIQNIKEISEKTKMIFKTAYEIPSKILIDLSKDRSPFIDQSQSFNLFFDKPDSKKLASCHFYSWKVGLKTAMYYLRIQPSVETIKYIKENETTNENTNTNINKKKYICNDDICTSCQ